jgi:hypothetical protein
MSEIRSVACWCSGCTRNTVVDRGSMKSCSHASYISYVDRSGFLTRLNTSRSDKTPESNNETLSHHHTRSLVYKAVFVVDVFGTNKEIIVRGIWGLEAASILSF